MQRAKSRPLKNADPDVHRGRNRVCFGNVETAQMLEFRRCWMSVDLSYPSKLHGEVVSQRLVFRVFALQWAFGGGGGGRESGTGAGVMGLPFLIQSPTSLVQLAICYARRVTIDRMHGVFLHPTSVDSSPMVYKACNWIPCCYSRDAPILVARNTRPAITMASIHGSV